MPREIMLDSVLSPKELLKKYDLLIAYPNLTYNCPFSKKLKIK